MAIAEDVIQTALGLPVEDRAALAERLLASLDDLDERESDRLWGEEAERRLVAYRAGSASARPAEDVYARAERLLSD
jgi:putative addiction module component (TIGR02574 family)